jgi:hypothetical protein
VAALAHWAEENIDAVLTAQQSFDASKGSQAHMR